MLAQRQLLRGLWGVLFFLLLVRLLAMYAIPLNDSTEARYGEIARIMLETHNWVTPMHQYNVPFWAKPPLSIWCSALSMHFLGVNAFAARLPGLLWSCGVLALVWSLARRQGGIVSAVVAIMVLAGSLYFYLDAGTVMTDPALLFSTTLITVAFWRAIVYQERIWSYIFFVALGLGLLAKGPVALILAGMPIGLWTIIAKRWSAVWRDLPWLSGILLTSVIALPWYVWAEIKTPGFLQYFIIGEHLQRFLQPGWQGDKYGFAHVAPYGMIWIYALLGLFPWCIPAVLYLGRHIKRLAGCWQEDWIRYCLCCAVTPLVFFTFARNIIYPYVFPSLPPLALLCAAIATRYALSAQQVKRFLPLAISSAVVFLVGTLVFILRPELVAKSQDRVVAVFKSQHPGAQSRLIYWTAKTDYSAQFYSGGRASATLYPEALCHLLANGARNYVVQDSEETRPIPQNVQSQLRELARVKVLAKQYTVYAADHSPCGPKA